MRRFEADNTIQFKARFYNFQGNLKNADATPKITIYTTRGAAKLSEADMTRDTRYSSGVYHYYWTPDISDKYLLKIHGVVLGRTSLIRRAFKVEETTTD